MAVTPFVEAVGFNAIRDALNPIGCSPSFTGEVFSFATVETKGGVRPPTSHSHQPRQQNVVQEPKPQRQLSIRATAFLDHGPVIQRFESMKPGDGRHAARRIEPAPEEVKRPAQITVEDDDVVAREVARHEPQGKEDRIESCPLRPSKGIAREDIDLMPFRLKMPCLMRKRPIHGGLDVRWGMRREENPQAHCAASSNTRRSRRTCSSKVNSFATSSAPQRRRSYVPGLCSARTIASARPSTVGGRPGART